MNIMIQYQCIQFILLIKLKNMKNKIRFFTENEIKELAPYVESGTIPNKEFRIAFQIKYNRNSNSIYSYLHGFKKKSQKIVKKQVEKKKSTYVPVKDRSLKKDTSILKKNEFIIPIKNWELRTVDGESQLVLIFK